MKNTCIKQWRGDGATKRASSSVYIIPSTYTREIFGLLTYFTKGTELCEKDQTILLLIMFYVIKLEVNIFYYGGKYIILHR